MGAEYDVFSWREIVRCICGTLGDHCRRVQKLVYFKNFGTVAVEKIFMATNNSGSNSTCLLVSREEELSGEELAKRIAEEKCLCCILRLVY